jgi:hypothetical protein
MQLNNRSLKTIFSVAGALSVGFGLANAAVAQDAEDLEILDAYTPPETQTYDPIYNIVDFDRVKPFLCTNNPGPLCNDEIDNDLRLSDAFPARYGVTDEMRRPASFYCLNNVNVLCENPLNFDLEREPVGSDLRARTRDLWAQLDEQRTAPSTELPPRTTAPVTPAPTTRPAPGPVPGLW